MSVNMDAALTDTQFKLIGVELRLYSREHGQQELAMFETGLVLPRIRSLPGAITTYADAYMPNVTLHTTVGDYTLVGYDPALW